MSAHCAFCADPYRAVLLSLVAKKLPLHVIARHYGIPRTSVGVVAQHGAANGCLPVRECSCGVPISTRQDNCGAKECWTKAERQRVRLRRARHGWGKSGEQAAPKIRPEPAGFDWPVLPANPRARRERAPTPVLAPPLKHPTSLLGLGNRTADVKAKARLSAGYLLPAKEVAVMPWRAPLAPPRCPTIGSLVHGRMAA